MMLRIVRLREKKDEKKRIKEKKRGEDMYVRDGNNGIELIHRSL